jgi:hypothetical protein
VTPRKRDVRGRIYVCVEILFKQSRVQTQLTNFARLETNVSPIRVGRVNHPVNKSLSPYFLGYDFNISSIYCDLVRHIKECNNDTVTTENKDDITGAPRNLKITQKGGYVMFEFQDNSMMCKDSYAFTRELGDFETTCTSTTRFLDDTRTTCSKNIIVPGHSTSDNLLVSQLQVGQNYTYCVRVTAKEYMHHPIKAEEPNLSSSDETCKTRKIQWEASIQGKITLEKNAGALAVPNVQVSWEVLDPTNIDNILVVGSTIMTTGRSGTFEIVLNEDLDAGGSMNMNEQEYSESLSLQAASCTSSSYRPVFTTRALTSSNSL